MPTKKPVRAKKPVRRDERIRGLTSAIGPKATTAVVICVLAGGLVIGERLRPSKDRGDGAVGTTGADVVLAADSAAAATPGTKKTPNAPVVDDASATPTKQPFVTIAGCLERDNDRFRLKDTTGNDAPKSRSWKSGFLKKGSASIDVLDPARSARLGEYVGKRVSVTGTLTERQMKIKSIRRVATTCE